MRANFSWTLIGNLVYAGCQWGLLVLMTKLGSPEMVGRFSLALAVTAPIILFCNLNLRAIQATDAAGAYRFGDYLGLRLVTCGLALAATVTLASSYRADVGWTILAVGVVKLIESLSDILFGLLQQHERMDRIGISLIAKGGMSLLALGAALWLTRDLLGGLLRGGCLGRGAGPLRSSQRATRARIEDRNPA